MLWMSHTCCVPTFSVLRGGRQCREAQEDVQKPGTSRDSAPGAVSKEYSPHGDDESNSCTDADKEDTLIAFLGPFCPSTRQLEQASIIHRVVKRLSSA